VYLAGSLVALVDRNWAAGTTVVKYQHTDALGSPVAVTDAAGQVIERTAWEPYGAAIGKTIDGVGYTGHVMDAATGLVQMQQRYYDPDSGRFLSIDPVAADSNTGGNFNRYWYADNNPYKFTDPDGRNAVTAIGGAIHEAGQFLQGKGFDEQMVMGALADGYNGEGGGFASAAFQDATTLIPAGAALGVVGKVGLAIREASALAKTAHGATRIGAASLRGGALNRTQIAATRLAGTKFTQSNGARAYVTKTANGKFNVAIFGEKGYMSSMKNISEKKLLKQAEKYGWKTK
jgi:RHS repeat-associated protein